MAVPSMTRRDPFVYAPTVVTAAGATTCLALGAVSVAVLLASWAAIDWMYARRRARA